MIGPLDMVALLAVLFIGVPHGAADAAIAMQTQLADTREKLIAFLLLYCTITGLVVAAWYIAPNIALLVFLALTMFHFGRGDALVYGRAAVNLRALLHGGFIISVALVHETEVSALFRLLTAQDAWPIMTTLRVAFLLWLIALGVSLIGNKITLSALGEITALFALAFALPPLIAFAVYFCGVHSRRHFIRLARDPRLNTPTHRRFALWLAAISIFTIASAAYLINPQLIGNGLMQSLFIALAALTVPHMLLVDGFDPINKTGPELTNASA